MFGGGPSWTRSLDAILIHTALLPLSASPELSLVPARRPAAQLAPSSAVQLAINRFDPITVGVAVILHYSTLSQAGHASHMTLSSFGHC